MPRPVRQRRRDHEITLRVPAEGRVPGWLTGGMRSFGRGREPADAAGTRRDGSSTTRSRSTWPALAAIAHVSEAHFIRSFRATFGETPHRYLQRRRIERAMYLLRTTDRSVTDICMDVGFSSLGTFSRTFREIVGETPSQFRRDGGPMPEVPSCFVQGLDPTEQFRRSRRDRSRAVPSTACTTRSPAPRSSCSTKTSARLLRRTSSASRSAPTSTSGSCAGSPCACPVIPTAQILLEKPGPAVHGRGHRRPGAGARHQGRDGRLALHHHRRRPGHVRDAEERASRSPTSRRPKPYGIDFGIRDPFGNAIRIGQMFDNAGG